MGASAVLMKDIEYSAGRVNSGENKEQLFVAYTCGRTEVFACVEGRKRDNIFIGHISIEKYPAGKALCSAWRGHGAEVFLICISMSFSYALSWGNEQQPIFKTCTVVIKVRSMVC